MTNRTIIPFLLLLTPFAASASGCSSARDDEPTTTTTFAATQGLTYLSGSAAEAQLGPTRQKWLAQLRAETGSAVSVTVDAATSAILTIDLGDGWISNAGAGKIATDFLSRYQYLIDPRVSASELVPASTPQICHGSVSEFDRYVAGLPVVGSRITLAMAPDGRVARVVNGVVSVYGKVAQPAVQGTPLSKLLPPKLTTKDVVRQQALAPTPDGSALMPVDVVSWPTAPETYAGVLAVGDVAVSPTLHAAGSEAAGPSAAHVGAAGTPDVVDFHATNGAVVNVLAWERNPAEIAYRFLEENPSIYRSGIARCQFAPKSVAEDSAAPGTAYVRVEQRHAGIPVAGNELLFQVRAGRVVSVLGRSLPRIDLDPTPTISPSDADSAVVAALTGAAATYPAQTAAIDAALAVTPHIRLIVLPAAMSRTSTTDRLAYEVKRGQFVLYVDAQTNALLGIDALAANETDVNEANDASELGLLGYTRVVTDTTGTPTAGASTAALAADAALQATQAAYASLGRVGLDGSGSAFVANIDVSLLTGCGHIAWFMPIVDQAFFCRNFAVTDIVAHEQTHGVMFHTSNVGLSDQSGAINEAYADLMGQLIQPNPVVPPATTPGWRVGFNLPGGGIRDMANPGLFGQPATMSAYIPRTAGAGCDFWPFSCDWGNVHANDGIVNKGHQLLTDGVPGLTPGIGRAKMFKLGFLTFTQRLMPGELMNDIPAATLDACQTLVASGATDLTGAPFLTSDCDQIPIAFDQVGLSSGLTTGWTAPPLGFDGDQSFYGSGETTPTGCNVTDVLGAMTTLSGDIDIGLGSMSGLPQSADWLGLRGIDFVVPAGAGPNPFPIGTPFEAHTVHWFDAFGQAFGTPEISTAVIVAAPPAGAPDCRTPTGFLPVSRFSDTHAHTNAFWENGTDVTGDTASTMNGLCAVIDTQVEIVDSSGRLLQGPAHSVRDRVTQNFLFVTFDFDSNATVTSFPTGAPNMSANVVWQHDIGRESRFRLQYSISQPVGIGVTCTP